ncbi:MAG: NAD(P)/FAD-dependent oxidoreductase [Myxococcales bacterium]|nr:NAD(P)/FAD-dependent oxidoreductase [Myxococcales bacterium]
MSDGHFDVVICGGGLAGLTLALQLRQELPDATVAIVERTARPLPRGAHKVGESSVEAGSMYLERLGLRRYLHENQIIKFGLRFFPGGGHLPIDQRWEIGPRADPIVDSYQMDRGKLERDLRDLVVERGATLFEGTTVTAVELGEADAPHRVRLDGDALTARWVVDATGRAAFLRKRLKLNRPSEHQAHAGWFRLSGKVDINEMVADPADPWRQRLGAESRWRSTNHFMGDGYWVWVIPLVDGRTSIGVVVHDERHGFDDVRTLERCWAFLDAHEPTRSAFLKAHLAAGHEVLDFKCLKGYSHDVAQSWSPNRWAVVGEAGAFVDPLYSPGTDFIAMANSFTTAIVRSDLEGADLAQRCAELDAHYASLVQWATGVFRGAAPVYGYAPAMATKYYWDNFIYWSYFCQFLQQRIHALRGDALAAFVPVRERFFEVTARMQTLLRHWALLAPTQPAQGQFVPMPHLISLNADVHVALVHQMTPAETLAYFERRADQADEMLTETVLRVLQELGPEQGRRLVEASGLTAWDLRFSSARIEAETLDAEAREAALSLVARDLDRNLYPLRRHPRSVEAMRLVTD